MNSEMRFLGVDLAPNHSGWVCLGERGQLLDLAFLTDRAASVKGRSGCGYCLPVPKVDDPEVRDLLRLDRALPVFEALLERFRPSFVGLEGYAFGSVTGAHSKGEFGGLFRLVVWRSGAPLRVHDPMTVKKFVAGSGSAEKEDMISSIVAAGGPDYTTYCDGSKGGLVVAGDLADAHGLALMVRAEWMLRTGRLSLSSLLPHQLEVVNRVTKASPVALLQRGWIADTRKGAETDRASGGVCQAIVGGRMNEVD